MPTWRSYARSFRPRRVFRLCFLVGIAAVFEQAAPVLAQGGPPVRAPEGVPAGPPPVAPTRPWRLDLTAGTGYDDNIRFTAPKESAAVNRLRAGLTRLMRSPRANLTLGAAGEGTVYRPVSDFNGFNYSGDLSVSYLISPRTTFRVADSFSKSYTGESRVLIESGLFLPRIVSKSNDATIEASHRISPRWNWTVSARHRVIHFDSSLLIDGSTLGGRADLSFAPAPESPIGLYYEFGRTSPRGRPGYDIHGATLEMQRRLSRTLSVRLELGGRTLLSRGIEPDRVVPTGTVGLAIRSEKQTIEAAGVRSVDEAFGLGRLQSRSAASLRFARTLTSWMTLGLNASLNRSQDPGGNKNLTFDTRSLGGEVGFSLARDVHLSATGGYRGLDRPVGAPTESRFVGLALRIGKNW